MWWKMVIDATDPVAAAQEALRVQRDPESIATVYQVKAAGDEDGPVTVDLMDHPQPPSETNGYHSGYRDGYTRARTFYGDTQGWAAADVVRMALSVVIIWSGRWRRTE